MDTCPTCKSPCHTAREGKREKGGERREKNGNGRGGRRVRKKEGQGKSNGRWEGGWEEKVEGRGRGRRGCDPSIHNSLEKCTD